MADMFDRAQELDERERIHCIARQAGRSSELEVKAKGKCVYCELPIAKSAVNLRFCDADCRDLFEIDKKRGVKYTH